LVDTRARSSSDSEVVCGLLGVEWSVEQVPALWENRLAIREEEGEEECRKAGRWEEFRCCQGCCAKHTSRRREQDQLTGDEEGRRRVLARRADDGDQIDQLLVRDCVS
jgi:hypothetical protein